MTVTPITTSANHDNNKPWPTSRPPRVSVIIHICIYIYIYTYTYR